MRPGGMDARRAPSDHALALRAAAGDHDAFARLAARHRPMLVRAAARRLDGSVHHAEDAVQDALVRALRAMRAGKVPEEPRAWLLVMVRGCCADRRRATGPAAELGEPLPAAGPSPAETVAGRVALRQVVDAMRALPESQRAAVVGRELEGRSYAELAARQDTTVGAVKSLLVRARRTLAAAPGLQAAGAPFAALAVRLRASRAAELLAGPITADHGTTLAAVATVALAVTPSVSIVQPGSGAPARTDATAALVASAQRLPTRDGGERRRVAAAASSSAPTRARLAARETADAAAARAAACTSGLPAAPSAAQLRRTVA